MKKGRTNIFLTGMMGTGKSTVGRHLAHRLGMTFVDTDDALEEVTGMLIREILEQYSENRFRDMESALFHEMAQQANHVFSTGGGIVLRKQNRDVLKHHGLTILLRAHPRFLAKRIGDRTTRPLLDDADDIELRLKQIWNRRKKWYESTAHLIVDTDELSQEEMTQSIINHLADET